MTSPASGGSFLSPGTIVLQATASSSGSTISNITYMDGGSKIATVATGPSYTYNWKTASAGSHSVTAIAKDKTGATTTSAAVSITVTADAPPVVTLTSPADGFSTLGPVTINLAATAFSSDAIVTTVAFYEDGVKKATGKVSPYQFALKGVTAGSHAFYAIATDNLGVPGQSATATVNIIADVPPTVAITSPASAITSIAKAPISLKATASSTDEAITTVAFQYVNTPKNTAIATPKAPFSYTWKPSTLGTYSVVAVATDTLGVTTTSSPVSVTVVADQSPAVSVVSPASGSTYIAPASVELLASASSPDTTISSVTYYSATGKIATVTKAPYAYDWKPAGSGTFSVYAVVTDSVGTTAQSASVSFNVTSATTSTVKVTAPTSGKALAAPANVAIAASATIPSGDSISGVSFYASGTLLGTSTSSPYQYAWQNVPAGVYYLTAVVTDAHGATVTSSPVTFTSDTPPVVAVNTPGNQSVFAAPAVINLMAAVTDSGKITKVVFAHGSTTIGTATTAPYLISWTNVGVGTYTVTATAYDSLGITGTSSPLSLQVINDAGPVVTLETPSNALAFGALSVVNLAYSVTDAAAALTKVEIYRDGVLVATLTSSSSGSTWTFAESAPLPVGSYVYYARAYDSAGTSTDSVPATITVIPSLPYQTDFESGEGANYYNLGPLAGQGGWTNPQGTANISSVAYSGTQSLQVASGTPVATAQLSFVQAAGEGVIFCDFYAQPVAETAIASSSLFTAEQAQFGFVQTNGQAVLEVFRGDGNGAGAWSPTAFSVPIGSNNQVQNWVRLTARLDFSRQKWDMYANGTLVAYDVPFVGNASTYFSTFQAQGDASADTFVDLLSVTSTNPLFTDVNNDGIDDTWETQYGLSLSVNDRNLNVSGDGVPLIQDYLSGTSPLINTKVVPDPIQSGLVLHLRADAGVVADSSGNVSEWLDQSPNGNIAVQSQPSLLPLLVQNQSGGLPALAFNSTNGAPSLSLPFNMMQNAGAGEVIAIVKIGSNPNNFNNLWAFGSGFGSSYINAVHYEDFGTSDLGSITATPSEFGQYFIYDTSISSAGTSIFSYNGDSRWTRTNLPVQFNQYPTIGGLVGDIAEMIVYNRVLTDAERATLSTYLQGKYALPAIAVPATPSNLAATALSSDTVDLYWTAQNSLMHTVTTIQRQSGGGAFATVAQVSDAASYTDTGLLPGVTYSYQISIQSYVGTSGVSNTATVMPPASLADIPTQGMALWLRTTAGTLGAGGLANWVDQSGLGNNAVSFDQVSLPNVVEGQANGLPVVRFSGQNALLLPPFMLQSALAGQIFAVVRINNSSSGSTNILWGFGTGAQTTYFDSQLLDDFGSNDTSGFQETEAQISQYYVFDTSIDATGNGIHRYDGTAEWIRPPNANVQYGFQQFPSIGGYPPGNLNGDVAEVIIYSRVLSASEQNAVYAYLASKYSMPGIVANLDSPVITSAAATTGATGQAFTYQATATNSPTSFAAIGLPPGLSMSPLGLITGVPVSDGTSTVMITGTNGSGTGSLTLTITINPSIPVIGSPLTDSGQVGVPYSYSITASEGANSFSATGLPPGVSVTDPVAGVLSGTPTASGTYNVILTAMNAAGSGTATLVLTVSPPPPALTSPTSSSGTVGSSFTYSVTTNGTGVSYSATGLPPGLAIDPNSGVISGTPTAGGTFNVILSMRNSFGTGTANLTLSFSPNFPVTNGMLLWLRADQGVVANSGGNLSQWNDQSALGNFVFQSNSANEPTLVAGEVNGLPAVHFNGPNMLTLQTNMMQQAGEGQIIAVVRIGSNPNGFNTLWNFGTSSNGTGYFNTGHYDDFGNSDPASVTVESTSQIAQFFVYDTSISSGGLDVFRSNGTALWSRIEPQSALGFSSQIELGGPGTGSFFGDIAEIFVFNRVLSEQEQAQVYSYLASKYAMPAITGSVGSPAITSASSASGQAGAQFSFQVTASNSPTGFAATGLPIGLSMDSNGLISGVPAAVATYSAGVTATNASGTSSSPLAITITISPPQVTNGTASGVVGQAFGPYQVVASNSPTSYSASGLPTGLVIDPVAGVISGTPTTSGTFAVPISAANSGGSGSGTVTVTIAPQLALTSQSSETAALGSSFSYQVTANNGATSYSATGLPPGLSIDPNSGIISGAPSAVGSYSVNLTVNGTLGNFSAVLTITVGTNFPVTNGLVLLLQGDTGIQTETLNQAQVSVWRDQSGLGNDAVQTKNFQAPVTTPNAIGSSTSLHSVIQFSGNQVLGIANLLSSANTGDFFIVERGSGTPWSFGGNLGATFQPSFQNGSQVAPNSISDDFLSANQTRFYTTADFSAFNIYNASSSATQWTARLNGSTLFSTSSNTIAAPGSQSYASSGAAALGLGYTNDGNDIPINFSGDIAEVIVFNRILSDQERYSIGQYLQGKYGLPNVVLPPIPTNLQATAISSTQVYLSWNGNSAPAGTTYTIERQTGSDAPVTLALISDAQSYMDSGLTAGTTYSYQVIPETYAGASTGSNSVTVTTQASATDFPTIGMQLWLRSDAGLSNSSGAVFYWGDQSGQMNSAVPQLENGSSNQDAFYFSQIPTLATNVINGLPTIHFVSGNLPLATPNFDNTDIGGYVSAANSGDVFVVVRAASTNSASSLYSFSTNGSLYPNSDGTIRDGFLSAGQYNLGVPSVSVATFNLYNASVSFNNWAARLNGSYIFGTSANAIQSTPQDDPFGSIGGKGDIAEVIVYDRALSDSERFAVGQYLQNKYHLPNTQVPATPANVAATMDSFGSEITVTWNASSNAAEYVVQRSVDNGPWVTIGTAGNVGSQGNFNDTGMPASGTILQYQVEAQSYVGSSAFSAAASTYSPNAIDPNTDVPYWVDLELGLIPNVPASPFPSAPTQPTPTPTPAPTNAPLIIYLVVPANAYLQ